MREGEDPGIWPVELVSPDEVGFDPDRIRRVDELLRRWVEEGRLPGGLVAVARHGVLAHVCKYGWADRERGEELNWTTLFRIYSMTKPITSVAVLMLYEEGHFTLGDPVKWYLPEFGDVRVRERRPDGTEALVPPRRDITIHDLLTHTAGLGYDVVWEARRAGWSTAEVVRRIAEVPLLFHPGERWRYSSAHDVLGRLVEVISGEDLEQFFQRRIFAPLGMRDTFFHVPPGKRSRLAKLYRTGPDGRCVEQTDEDFAHDAPAQGTPCFLSGGAGLVSTAPDYLRFCLALLYEGQWRETRLLGRKTVELMRTDHLPQGHPAIEPHKLGYGLGVSVLRSLGEMQGLGSVGEFGWGGAAGTEMWIDPQEEMITLVMLQVRESGPRTCSKRLKIAVYQALVD